MVGREANHRFIPVTRALSIDPEGIGYLSRNTLMYNNIIIFAILIFFNIVFNNDNKELPKDHFDGKWKVVKYTFNGKTLQEGRDYEKNAVFDIKKGYFERNLKDGKNVKTEIISASIDVNSKKGNMDLQVITDNKKIKINCIFSLEAKKLKIGMYPEEELFELRPDDFSDSGISILYLEKI